MELNDKLPRPARRLSRVVLYGLAASIIVPMAYNYLSFNSSRAAATCLERLESPTETRLSPLYRTQRLAVCVQERGGIVARWQMGRLLAMLNSFPNTPCRYVGVWTSARPDSVYRVTLQDGGEFLAEPLKDHRGGDAYHGAWSVSGAQMAWFYDGDTVWPPDINPIEHESERRFTLIERDGTRTQFDLIADTDSQVCPRRFGS
ncbi:MAG TPA: hypothetical protein VMB75_02665 [Rhodocyclaceae bacterium]|nr:hypothetical protein [Rhodocyclaceae bacterium]